MTSRDLTTNMKKPGKNKPFFISWLFVLAAVVLFVQGCSNNVAYEKNKRIKNGIWNRFETMKFDLEIADTTQTYIVYLNVRNSVEYNYSNLFLFIHTSFPDNTVATDTVECIIAEKSGKWLGKGFGWIRENRLLMKRGVKFPLPGMYSIEIEQAMRIENLKGIEDIGIRIEKYTSQN